MGVWVAQDRPGRNPTYPRVREFMQKVLTDTSKQKTEQSHEDLVTMNPHTDTLRHADTHSHVCNNSEGDSSLNCWTRNIQTSLMEKEMKRRFPAIMLGH